MSDVAPALPDALAALFSTYHDYESKVEVRPAPVDGALKALVTFDDARSEPVHRWYSFKEGYSHRLLPWLQRESIVSCEGDVRLLDPFCGVATTLLANQLALPQQHGSSAFGIERNPAIRSVARAKLRWRSYDCRRVNELLTQLQNDGGRGCRRYAIPSLSTLTSVRKDGRCAFHRPALQDLLYYRQWIREHCVETLELAFFMLAWTAIIEASSNTRKDGRALRLVDKAVPDVRGLLLSKCELMLQDVCTLQDRPAPTPAQVLAGDARQLPFGDSSFTAICYSPPYLNNIDYSEVYKLELWLRGDVSTPEAFRALRLGTLRSHPSIRFPATQICDQLPATSWIRRLKKSLIAALPQDQFLKMRQELFAGYIDDLLLSLKEQSRVAKPGAPIVCVVGNSLHGGKPQASPLPDQAVGDQAVGDVAETRVAVCTDLLVAAAAQAVGLGVERLQVARQLPRRDNQNGWLRETIVVMRKPNCRA